MRVGDVIPIEVNVQLASHVGPSWEVASLRHREGWLIAAMASVSTPFGECSRLLIAAVDAHDDVLSPVLAHRLHRLAMSAPRDPEDAPPEELAAAIDALYWDFLGESDLQSLRQLEAEQAALDERVDEYVIECQLLQWRIRASLRNLRAEKIRLPPEAREHLVVHARIARLDQMLDELALGMRERVREMRAEIDELQDDVIASLKRHGEVETVAIIRWRDASTTGQSLNRYIGKPYVASDFWRVSRFGEREAWPQTNHMTSGSPPAKRPRRVPERRISVAKLSRPTVDKL
jgi:hypothetical protein